MRTNNVLGILFSNSYDAALPELTAQRTMGSVPFGCRYRLIDFPLSGMVNAGITKVGVVTKSNYRSLMDHLGMGRAWDLSRSRQEGLVLLPPFVGAGAGGNQTRMEGLRSAMEFLRNSKEEYVVMSDCNTVCSLDYRALLHEHVERDTDGNTVTIACRRGKAPSLRTLRLELGAQGRAERLSISDEPTDDTLYSLNIVVLRKALLERLVNEAYSIQCGDYDILLRSRQSLRLFGAEITAYARTIDSMQSYYDASMELRDSDCRAALFDPGRPVLTKVLGTMPAVYGLHSGVKNCLVGDGCVIKGEARDSVIFRNVVIEEGASVRGCVLMQGTRVSAGVTLNCVITDKSVVINPGKLIMGDRNFPVYLGKKIVV